MITYGWDADMVAPERENSSLGLESFQEEMTQGNKGDDSCDHFRPLNVVIEKGTYYATIYVDEAIMNPVSAQQVSIWLASLRDTDVVHLTVTANISDPPPNLMINLLAAFASTKAKIDIHLDQIVFDSLAYFYLLADHITKGVAGALFVPTYVAQRPEDMSSMWRAMHDFYKWIVESAVERKVLTQDEADRLNGGASVTIPNDRFETTGN